MAQSNVNEHIQIEQQFSVPLKFFLRVITLAMLMTMLVVWYLSLYPIYEAMTTPCQSVCDIGRLTSLDIAELEASNINIEFYGALNIFLESAIVLTYAACCLLLLWRFSRNWVAWVASLIFAGAAYVGNAGTYGFAQLQPSVLADLLNAVFNNLFTIALLVFAYIFPTGTFYPRFLLWPVLIFSGFMTIAGGSDTFSGEHAEWSQGLTYIWIGFFIVGIILQFRRYQLTTSRVTRLQMRWVGFGIAMVGMSLITYLVMILWWANQPGAPRGFIHVAYIFIFMITILPFPITVTMAILRYRLWNIDLIINRTLVYSVLTVIITSIYVIVVGALGAVFSTGENLIFSLLATGIIAISFHSLRDALQRGVNRMMFGQRDEPQSVLINLSEQLQSTIMPEDLLQVSIAVIGKSLRIPYVAITIRNGEDIVIHAEYGINETLTESFTLSHRHETVGELLVGQRSPAEPLNRADKLILSSVAQQLGAVVYAVRLQSDLQHAREKLVLAREEERRRLRRDLHDGLGPALASLPLKIDAAIDLMTVDEQTSLKLLGDVKREAQYLVTDVRRVVNDLRPPALDELGLVAALQSAVSQTSSHPSSTHITLNTDAVPRTIPAATEVAAYRITMEAVTNVIKHAQAMHCWVKLAYTPRPRRLQITIEDDGVGIPQPVTPNVGLRSMRERAEELGGTFEMRQRPEGGTCIGVTIPIPKGSNLS